ncbi:MAG: EAL domain-containing protein [Phycisphaeraceae bacterium]|nr:EAL domain-containing protein [Phycisphaeraceae bacterium]
MIPSRRRNALPFVVLALLAGLGPMVVVLWLSYSRALERSRESLQTVVDSAFHRAERILQTAEVLLTRLATQTQGKMTAETQGLLRQAVYNQPFFREAGLIDEDSMLVCTSLGPVEPPVRVDSASKSDPDRRAMQVVGVLKTEVMKERSIIVSLPTIGKGEVNLLIDPAVLIDPFVDTDLGPNGSVVFTSGGGQVLAANTTMAGDEAEDPARSRDVRVERRSDRFHLTVTGRISRPWALRYWLGDLALPVSVGLLCSAAMVTAVFRLSRRKQTMDAELRIALANDEFEVHYQPTVETTTGRCVGAEALIRWHHPEQGYIRPDIFIAVAEESGLIEPMTEALMRKVVIDIGVLLVAKPDMHVGINLAPDQFTTTRILEAVKEIFRPDGVPPSRVIFEATERSMIEDEAGLPHQVMDGLRALGGALALDDFGTGYSSLAYLHKFRFDYLKIDASFVKRIGTGSVNAGVIDSIIELGHRLEVKLIAEGVETEAQRAYLAERGVHYCQGWLFAKALTPREFHRFVEARAGIEPAKAAATEARSA